jgi:hypothetical protein
MKFKDVLNENYTDKKEWQNAVIKKYPKAKFERNNYPDLTAFCKGKQVGYWDAEQEEGIIDKDMKNLI